MSHDPELIERCAKALCDNMDEQQGLWSELGPKGQEEFRSLVRAVLDEAAKPAPGGPKMREDFEEAVLLAEIGEFLYSARAYSYGNGQTEPREYGIDWQWQQSKPDEYGQGVLLAEATKWHDEQAEGGAITEARKLRAALLPAPPEPPVPDEDPPRVDGEGE